MSSDLKDSGQMNILKVFSSWSQCYETVQQLQAFRNLIQYDKDSIDSWKQCSKMGLYLYVRVYSIWLWQTELCQIRAPYSKITYKSRINCEKTAVQSWSNCAGHDIVYEICGSRDYVIFIQLNWTMESQCMNNTATTLQLRYSTMFQQYHKRWYGDTPTQYNRRVEAMLFS